MISLRNFLLCIQNLAANRALLAGSQTGCSTGSINAGNRFLGVTISLDLFGVGITTCTSVSGVTCLSTSGSGYNSLMLVSGRRNRRCFSADFRIADGAVYNGIVAAIHSTGCTDVILGNSLGMRMSGRFQRRGLLHTTAASLDYIAVFGTGSLDFLDLGCINVSAGSSNRFLLAVKLLTTNRAVGYQVIRTILTTSSLYTVFFFGCLGVRQLFDVFGVSMTCIMLTSVSLHTLCRTSRRGGHFARVVVIKGGSLVILISITTCTSVSGVTCLGTSGSGYLGFVAMTGCFHFLVSGIIASRAVLVCFITCLSTSGCLCLNLDQIMRCRNNNDRQFIRTILILKVSIAMLTMPMFNVAILGATRRNSIHFRQSLMFAAVRAYSTLTVFVGVLSLTTRLHSVTRALIPVIVIIRGPLVTVSMGKLTNDHSRNLILCPILCKGRGIHRLSFTRARRIGCFRRNSCNRS